MINPQEKYDMMDKSMEKCPVCGEAGQYFPLYMTFGMSDGYEYYCGQFSYVRDSLNKRGFRTQYCDTWFPSVVQEEEWEKQRDEWDSKNRSSFLAQDEIYSDINMVNIDSGGFPISYEE